MRMNPSGEVEREIRRLSDKITRIQAPDGSWRFCFENAVLTDAYMIIVLRTLEIEDENLIRLLCERLLATQSADGAWRAFPDEREGNLSATVECYFALLYSGYSQVSDFAMAKARTFILSKGGLARISGLMTKVMLAASGQYPWPRSLKIPLESLLLPSSFPVHFFDFSGYARVHMIPALLLADRQYSIKTRMTPDLAPLIGSDLQTLGDDYRELRPFLEQIGQGISALAGLPAQLHEEAVRYAERYMLERIEPDGTFYSYATCTFLMIFAMLAIGYDKRHPVIMKAVLGLKAMICKTARPIFVQNSPPDIWDTALLSCALQEAGTLADNPAILRAATYLLSKQHDRPGDWVKHNRNVPPGGWGFSASNTRNPDVDDTTAALRAIKRFASADAAYRGAWNRGLNWLLSMQNDDGGWPAFEKNTDKEILALLPFAEAKSSAIDPSTPDLTGRTLEFLGKYAGLTVNQTRVRRGADWLIGHQEKDGSWYGRWGVCFIYGTWAALTGLTAIGIAPDHKAVRSGARWLAEIQNPDGGWGESCESDRQLRYIPLQGSTPSQTAWALDALISVHDTPTPAIRKGVQRLIGLTQEENAFTVYPTGAGLPGVFYSHYHSYRYIWPLLALAHYQNKYSS